MPRGRMVKSVVKKIACYGRTNVLKAKSEQVSVL
jgi:hypothetical protein